MFLTTENIKISQISKKLNTKLCRHGVNKFCGLYVLNSADFARNFKVIIIGKMFTQRSQRKRHAEVAEKKTDREPQS